MITIFIPVYNEESIIYNNTKKLRAFLNKHDVQYEIVFGNNGSTDQTLKIIKKLSRKNPKIIKYNTCREKGIGRSFRKLLQRYKFKTLIILDIDLPHNLDFLLKAKKLLEKKYDIVVGYKQGFYKKRTWYRKMITSININMCKFLLRVPYKDFGAGAKAYSYKFLKDKVKYIDNETFFTTKLLFMAHKENAHVVQVPVFCKDTRKSKINVVKLSFYITGNILKLALLRK